MKYFIVLCLLITIDTYAQHTDSIEFRNATWEEIKKKAKKTDKLIFIDVYTDWCAPCKRMDIVTFKDHSVIKESKNFICYKLNAEKGVGIELANQYNAHVYPTYLFVRHNGDLVYRTSGYQQAEKLLLNFKNALQQKNTKTKAEWEREYKSYKNGNKDTSFLYNYILYLSGIGDDTQQLVDEYIKIQDKKQLNSTKNIKLFYSSSQTCNSKAFDILLNNRSTLKKLYGFQYTTKLNEVIANSRQIAIENTNEEMLKATLKAAKKLYAPFELGFTSKMQMEYYDKTDNFDAYMKAAKTYLNKYVLPLDIDSLQQRDYKYFERVQRYGQVKEEELLQKRHRDCFNYSKLLTEAANKVIENSNKKEDYQQAIRWTQKAVEMLEIYNTLKTHAFVANLLELNNLAQKYAEMAINIANKNSTGIDRLNAILNK